jgi:hypothetical protein
MADQASREGGGAVRVLARRELVVMADHGQIYIIGGGVSDEFSDPNDFDPAGGPFLRALADATDSRRFVGSAGRGFVDLLTPGQYNFKTPVTVEVWSGEPPDDRDGCDHEVDIDLDVPDGRIVFEGSGGMPGVETEVPAGSYRMRLTGAGYDASAGGGNGGDSYRVRLWPRESVKPPELRKSWPGWEHYR